MNKRQVGSSYEEVAAAYLIEKGFQILEHNYRSRNGEIDLIAKDEKYLVFIEVKYRKDNHMGSPEEAVTYRKQQTIRKAAEYYLYSNKYSQEQPCRFDVVAILGEQVTLLPNAF